MKLIRIIETAGGRIVEVEMRSKGAGFRDILLNGERVGWAHTTYDGWAAQFDRNPADGTQRFSNVGDGLRSTFEAVVEYVRGRP